ncbi:BamA/TamA family outer membrane protein [Chelativorans sp. ZYF759]|nr:BamA/TamA family outer membrane protein [Chelativorans sp. ZYF759]
MNDFIGEPQFYEVEFVVTGDDDLADRLRQASSLWADRDDPASGVPGLVTKARGDYRRILAALYAEARYGGAISIRVEGREVADLPPDATLPATASVLVTVDTGPLFRFGRADIVNAPPPLPADRRDEVDDPRERGFALGEDARSGAILRAERLSVEAWRHHGHAKAEIADRRVEAVHAVSEVEAVITVAPGQLARYGPVGVRGAERLDPEWLAWMTGLVPGEVYDPRDLQRAGTRLARLDVFRSQRFEEAESIGADGLLPIDLIVQERQPRRIGIGGSYSTVDGFGAEAFWLHRNLFGRAERLRLDARVGGIGRSWQPRNWTYRLGSRFTMPGIFTPDTDFSAGLAGEREVLDAYTRTGVDAEAGVTHIFDDQLSGRLFANVSAARFEDGLRFAYPRREFVTAGLLGGLTFDNRDDPANATRGIYADVTLQPFHEFVFTNTAIRATAEARAYFSLTGDDGLVLAGRARLGTLAGAPAAETPPDKLFLAGGGGSVRGYPFRSIGIQQGNQIIGGRSLVEASAEVRARVTDTIGLVGFFDAGHVGADPVPNFSEGFRMGAGVGLRYQTGLGPIRLDVAVPINRRSSDPRAAFYVGIGQAF